MLKIKNLDFSYNETPVLRQINLSISPAEFIGIIGPNGAGKSTLLKLMTGIISLPEQSIVLHEKYIENYSRKKLAQNIAYVPQETQFSFSFNAREIVKMGRFPYSQGFGYYLAEDKEIVQEAMAKLEVTEFAERNFNALSGGEKQRVVIASALAQQPEILLLDEPTSALDLHHQIGIYKILKSLQSETKLTTLVVTHDINLASQFCDRIILLNSGEIIKDGTPSEVLQFKLLQEIFGVNVYIDINPMTKSLYILPYG